MHLSLDCSVAGHQYCAHLQCHSHCPRLSEAHQSQEADREGAGRVWNPAQQETSWHHVQEEGEGWNQLDHNHLRP